MCYFSHSSAIKWSSLFTKVKGTITFLKKRWYETIAKKLVQFFDGLLDYYTFYKLLPLATGLRVWGAKRSEVRDSIKIYSRINWLSIYSQIKN